MSAPGHAEPIGQVAGERNPKVTCNGCGFRGTLADLLCVDQDEDTNIWCPQCRTMGWTYD